jgi:hypothetical protein
VPEQNTAEPEAPETTESVREAAWQIVDLLDYGQASWVKIEQQIPWSGPTLRRAAAALGRAGVVTFDRKTGMWSRVEDVEVPASLWPRHALIDALGRGCQSAEADHVKSLLARARSVMRGDAWEPADFDALTDAIDQALDDDRGDA